MKTSDEIRKEIEILEAEAVGLRARIAEHEKDMAACRERLHEVVGYGRRGLIEDAKRRLDAAIRADADSKYPIVRVIDKHSGKEWQRRFVKKTKKLIFIRRRFHDGDDRFRLDGSYGSWAGYQIHPEDLAKILDGTL